MYISEFAVSADVLIFLLPSYRSEFNRCFTGLLVILCVSKEIYR